MDQKLQNLLYSVSSRTAWVVIGSGTAYWLICLTGILTPPVSAPPNMALLWFYSMLMLALASGVAAVAAAALLLIRRRNPAVALAAAPPPGVEADDAGRDQLAGLGRILDDPQNLTSSGAAPEPGRHPATTVQEPVQKSSRPAPAPTSLKPKSSKPKSRKRRR